MIVFIVLTGWFAATVILWPLGYVLHRLLRNYRRY